MRWLLTGAHGMLGVDATALLRSRGHHVTATDRDTVDITDEAAVARALAGHDIVMNCAAYTAVDDAETAEAVAFDVNALGAAVLARIAREQGARMVQVSTDYVFDGRATEPYAVGQMVRPGSAYGRTKAAGEWAVRAEHPDDSLVVRTAWLYGAHGRCFPKTIARVAAERGAVAVVDDQVGQPTWTRDVADLVERLVAAEAPAGTYHAVSSGQASWFEFAQRVCASAGLGEDVVSATTSAEFVRPAPRPPYSVLALDALEKVGVTPIGDWRRRWETAAPEVLAAS